MSQETRSETEPGAISGGLGGKLLVLAVFAVGFINFPLRVVGWRFDYLPGDGIDNRLNNFVLEHGYRYLTGRADSFWNAPAFYPVPGITACSDTHIGMLPFYALLRGAGLSPEAAFQGWFVIPFALNFAAAAWALRRLGTGWAGVAAGSYLFAFGIPLAGQLIHAQLFPRFFVPPAVVFGWEFLRSPRIYPLAACLCAVVGQVILGVYNGYFLVLLLATGFVVSVLRFPSQLPWRDLINPGRRVWLSRSALLLTAVLTLLPLGIAHARKIGSEGQEFIRSIAPRPNAWTRPSEVSAVFPYITEPNSEMEQEQQLFAGSSAFLAIGLSLFAMIGARNIGSRKATIAVAGFSTLVLALLVTVTYDVWPYQLVMEIPGGNKIRAVARIVLVLLFPIAVAVAAAVDQAIAWAGRLGRAGAVVACLAAVGLVATEQWLSPTDGNRESTWKTVRYSRSAVEARQDELKDLIRKHPSPTMVYVFPSLGREDSDTAIVQVVAMRSAQDLGIPCVNGYSGYVPIGWSFFPPVAN